MVKTNILGTEYTFEMADLNFPDIEGFDGKCYTYSKRIVVRDPQYLLPDGTEDAKRQRFKETLIHELIHGYCKESGVFYDDNENLVDWIAFMLPKIVNSYNDITQQIKENNKVGSKDKVSG